MADLRQTGWLRLRPTRLDRRVAEAVARQATPAMERPARVLTWLGDEHLLLAAAGMLLLGTAVTGGGRRAQASRLLADMVVTAALPHLLKACIMQERPDRSVVRGRRHGVPRSGRPYDAFPSGHAMHLGALASALGDIVPRRRGLAWLVTGAIASTRVLILAHWLSDVLVGFAVGVAIDRSLGRAVADAAARQGEQSG